jgi:predicted enzyme related to lactoylglutathione lyase
MGVPSNTEEETYAIFHKKGTSVHGGISLVKDRNLIVSPKGLEDIAVRVTMTVDEVSKALEDIVKAGGKVVRLVFS